MYTTTMTVAYDNWTIAGGSDFTMTVAYDNCRRQRQITIGRLQLEDESCRRDLGITEDEAIAADKKPGVDTH